MNRKDSIFLMESGFARDGAGWMEWKMTIVGDMTRWQYEQVQQDMNVHTCELTWHNGGHFTDVAHRIAQGFIWMIEHTRD